MVDSDPFSIAKTTLQMVAKFSTPPTPEVYEVWYRFAEGQHDAIRDQLQSIVENAESVSSEQIERVEAHYLGLCI